MKRKPRRSPTGRSRFAARRLTNGPATGASPRMAPRQLFPPPSPGIIDTRPDTICYPVQGEGGMKRCDNNTDYQVLVMPWLSTSANG